jgi:hypothetical protein
MRSMRDQTHDAKPMPHAQDGMTGPHGSMDDHGETHGHDDHAHGSDAMTLGPMDTAAWGAGAGGILLGLVVAIALALSSGFLKL